MNDPFAPPIHDGPPPAPKPTHDPARGPWRCEGRVLSRSNARWPARCVKCNSSDALVHGVFVRHVPLWVYLIFPFGVIPFLILWKSNARLGVAAVFLCGRHRRTRALSRLSYPLAAVAVAVVAMAVGPRMD